MYVKLKFADFIGLAFISQLEYNQCPDYPEYNDDIILHLDQGVVIRVPGCIVRDDYEGIMLREALIESDKLPDVIDFTKEAWEGKFECWDAQGNDILNPPDNPLTKKLKARKNFNVIK